MHFKRGNVDKKSGPNKLLVLVMIAQDVTDVLTQKAFDAFAKFLNAVDVRLLHPPCAVSGIGRSRFELFYSFLDFVIPRNIADEIFDRWKRTNGFDRNRLVQRDRVQSRHAHQLWLPVDLGRT